MFVFGGPVLSEILSPTTWGRYVIFNNLELQVYDSNPLLNKGMHAPLTGMSMPFSLAVLVSYIAALLAVVTWVFYKRHVY